MNHHSGNSARAFTLLELMAVIAIFLILAIFTVPALSDILNSLRISTDANKIAGEIEFARSTALAKNAPVEIWFIADNATNDFRIMRTGLLNREEILDWLSPQIVLRENLAFATSSQLSNILGAQTPVSHPQLPGGNRGVALRIYPSGRAELRAPKSPAPSPTTPLFFTIVSLKNFDEASGSPPDNFATIQVNPINSSVTVHRP